MKPYFITLEGVEGAGKSTQMKRISGWLAAQGHTVVESREPGGTHISEMIRDVVLHGDHPEMSAHTELMLIFAARAQHVHELIRPALDAGKTVLCDRFTDASYAYQGGGRGIPERDIATLEQMAQGDLRPDLTLLLDLPAKEGLARADGRGSEDRFETESLAFLDRARRAYLARAAGDPSRYVVIDAARSVTRVWRDIQDALEQRLK
ncbi:MAG: dTMP kinase [Xanthomonadales bacterium]|nr:dTMP kinase [Xanthomonadales bacterium]